MQWKRENIHAIIRIIKENLADVTFYKQRWEHKCGP